MSVYLLGDEPIFPHPALAREDGLLAVGGDLSAERLMNAYYNGIFPWFNPEDDILWWAPDPRYVISLDTLKVSKSMRNILNQRKFRISVNDCFTDVIHECAEVKRKESTDTWISNEMMQAYLDLHDLGFAHSVEVWEGQELVGGLYGVKINQVFCGESMFSKVSNASKFALISLVREKLFETRLVDCQLKTDHLVSMGAVPISRDSFLETLVAI